MGLGEERRLAHRADVVDSEGVATAEDGERAGHGGPALTLGG